MKPKEIAKNLISIQGLPIYLDHQCMSGDDVEKFGKWLESGIIHKAARMLEQCTCKKDK